MKMVLESIEELMQHPSPGLVFGPHDRALLPRRAHPTSHAWKGHMSAEESRLLTQLAAGLPARNGLEALYKRSNGVDLFILKCPNCEEPHPAISFLPVSQWESATAAWKGDSEMASFMEGCDLYSQGEWRVIGSMASEEMRLVQFFSGNFEGEDVAGRIYCIGLDGYLGFEDVVAESVDELLDQVLKDPAAFFDRVGFTWLVDTDQGCFGDPIEAYTADVRQHPHSSPWPPTRNHE